MSHSEPSPNLNTIVPSIIRTAVPAAWGALIALLVKMIPAVEPVVDDAVLLGQVITWAIIALWYALSRWLEPKVPVFLRTILFGSTKQPVAYSKHPEVVQRTLRDAA
jgi:hypothetical protein